MNLLIVVIAIAVFLAIICIFAALRRKNGADGRMATRLDAFRGDEAAGLAVPATVATVTKAQRSYSGLPVLSAFLAQFKGSEAAAVELERAGVPLRVGEYYMIRWGMAAIMFIVPFIFAQSAFTFLVGLVTGVIGYVLPALWLGGKRKKRMDRINAQLVDMLGMVANSLKSGYGLMQSFEFASRQMDAPLAVELRRMLREANLGLSAEDALNALGQRINSKDLDMVLTAINIQRTVGGNLAEILEKVAFTMRERERIRGEINTLTAQGKMSAIVIGGLPVFMFGIFMVMNPSYMSLLFTDMTGRALMGAAIFLEFLGYLTIKRVMAIEI